MRPLAAPVVFSFVEEASAAAGFDFACVRRQRGSRNARTPAVPSPDPPKVAG